MKCCELAVNSDFRELEITKLISVILTVTVRITEINFVISNSRKSEFTANSQHFIVLDESHYSNRLEEVGFDPVTPSMLA